MEHEGQGGDRSSVDAGVLERAFSADRAKAFVDAVVAIAMTLLILPLMESASELGGEERGLGSWFGDHAGQITGFLISFVVIGTFWIGHHRVFAQVEVISSQLVWLNIAWLLTIVWLPVGTALIGHGDSRSPAVMVTYIAGMFLTVVVWLFIWLYLARHPELHVFTAEWLRSGVITASSNVILFGLAGLLAGVVPVVGYYWLTILFLSRPLCMLLRPLFRRWTPRPGTAGPDA